MRRLSIGLVLATAIALLVAMPVFGAPAIALNAGSEADKVTGGGNGFFSYTIAGNQFCYTLSVHDMTGTPIAAHVHLAPRGIAGQVVIPLVAPAAPTGSVSECTNADAAVLAAIQADPGAYYVNVHTLAYPAGEIRAQLK
jgi:CHRD domain